MPVFNFDQLNDPNLISLKEDDKKNGSMDD